MDKSETMESIIEEFEQFCEEENYNKVKEYLIKYKGLGNYNNGYFFETVADNGNLELIKLFVAHGADIHIDNNYVLYTCAYNNHNDCVHYLLENGANVEDIKHTCGYKNAINIRDSSPFKRT